MRYLLFFYCFAVVGLTRAQLNMTQLGYLDIPTLHSTGLNDIWGYTDELGNEYALVGAKDGVSIVDVTVPTSPVEVKWIPGMNSIWRDIKTVGDYAYVTTEAEEGLLIIDLSPLPASTTLPTNYYTGSVGSEWLTAHNLYADNGYVYITGAGRGNGGLIILDVLTDPMNPIEVGEFDNWYAHDCFVKDDTAYLANIYDGFFSVLDITVKSSPVLLGTSFTPTNFSHNIWVSDDGNYAFTTDEVSGGFIGAFDVSNPANIKFLDKIQSSPGDGIVPHNCHVKGNYLYTSHYSDGVVVHDITYPYNLIEVGNFDTNPINVTTTDGCWGVYPFFASGNIVASDRNEGLFILSSGVSQGAYLEGAVTEMGTGNPINNVTISIVGENITDYSKILGDYAAGVVNSGTYDVNYFKVLYYPQTISTNLTAGNVAIQDVVLEKIPQFNLTVTVLDAITLNPIENANVKLQHTYIAHEGLTDVNGEIVLGMYYQDNYQIYAGKWSYDTDCFVDSMITSSTGDITLYIKSGVYDDFTFDYGWTSAGNAARGFWEREKPVGVTGGNGEIQNPYNDVPWDCGSFAFLTGNGTQASNTEEVNGGEVVLISPVFDLSSYTDPYVNYASWFYNRHGYQPLNDTLKIYLYDGINPAVLIDKKFHNNTNMSYWVPNSVRVLDYIGLSSTMYFVATLSDENITENVTEGGIDNFSITNFSMLNVADEAENDITLYPNPTTGLIHLEGIQAGQYTIIDASGRFILSDQLRQDINIEYLQNGIYFIRFNDELGNTITTKKIIKQ